MKIFPEQRRRTADRDVDRRDTAKAETLMSENLRRAEYEQDQEQAASTRGTLRLAR